MPLETILQAVANVGFPIAVCAYLLVRIEGKLEALSESIAELAGVVENARLQEEKR
ncbi:MAG: YvrJ family protein [Eubacteriales bacterium]